MAVFTEQVVIGNTPVPVDTTGQSINVGNFPASQPVSGTVAVSNFPATQPVSGTVNIGTIPEVEIKNDAGNPIPVTSGSIATATVTANSVGAGAPVTLLASRPARSKVILFNETGALFVKLGTSASSADYSMRLTANASWEFSGYSGIVTAIKQSGTTNVQATDI